MSVLCHNCGTSLHWNYVLEAEAKEHGHEVYCKTCAKLYRRKKEIDIITLKQRSL